MTEPSAPAHPTSADASRSSRPGSSLSVRLLSRRVALQTTAIVAVAYVLIAMVVAVIVTNMQMTRVEDQLRFALSGPFQGGPRPGDFPGGRFDPSVQNPNGTPVLEWEILTGGIARPVGLNSLDLPSQYANVTGFQTIAIGGQNFLATSGTDRNGNHVVVAQSLQNVSNTQTTVVAAEIGIGAALILFVFLGAMAIGRRTAQPIEDARQRQLEFTADASHELRTPLSVIEAQTTLALAKERPNDWYRTAFTRVDAESKRMRRLVDDMLWLARFDATQGHPDAEPVDVNILAGATVDRFKAVAETRHLALGVDGQDGQIVTVPPEWLDRLLGVLLDNACKYSPEGGMVAVSVAGEGKRVRLTVDDSGPGIPPEERERIFDRFHRATDTPGGAGLGLAIADAIVKATNGHWTIGTSPAGGASISVSWPRSISGPSVRREERPGERREERHAERHGAEGSTP